MIRTLKCELTCDYMTRLMNHMDKHHYRMCVPATNSSSSKGSSSNGSNGAVEMRRLPAIDFTSGYVTRSIGTVTANCLTATC